MVSGGHKPAQRVSKRSLKVLPGSKCERRDALKVAYESSEVDTGKRLNLFKALHAHERKHECGLKFAGAPQISGRIPE